MRYRRHWRRGSTVPYVLHVTDESICFLKETPRWASVYASSHHLLRAVQRTFSVIFIHRMVHQVLPLSSTLRDASRVLSQTPVLIATSHFSFVNILANPMVKNRTRTERITDLADHRVEDATEVLVAAFAEDPVARAMVGGRDDLRVQMHRAVVRATIVGGEMWIATTDDGRVVGTACWYPPGSDFLADDAQTSQGFADFFAQLERVDPGIHKWWLETLMPAYGNISKRFYASPDDPEGVNFKKNNWNVVSWTVLPEFQRQGIGKTLMQIGEAKAAEQHLRVCVETESEEHVQMYRQFGYELVGSEYVQGPPGVPGYHEFILIKSPQA